jgi:hypothetical protein
MRARVCGRVVTSLQGKGEHCVSRGVGTNGGGHGVCERGMEQQGVAVGRWLSFCVVPDRLMHHSFWVAGAALAHSGSQTLTVLVSVKDGGGVGF